MISAGIVPIGVDCREGPLARPLLAGGRPLLAGGRPLLARISCNRGLPST